MLKMHKCLTLNYMSGYFNPKNGGSSTKLQSLNPGISSYFSGKFKHRGECTESSNYIQFCSLTWRGQRAKSI